ncbi:MAG TPA: hypothetical protein PKY81_01255 [bacterium]|nr:hypothetical protein [bacterium]HPN29561.1 hypothetical protein [bacterium]
MSIGICGAALAYIQMNQDAGGRIVSELFTSVPFKVITFDLLNRDSRKAKNQHNYILIFSN